MINVSLLNQVRRPLDRERPAVSPLGTIGQLAEDLRYAARYVADNMHTTPGGDAYEYSGSAAGVQDLLAALNALEHFQAGWR